MPKLFFDDFAVGSDLPETSSAVTAEDAGFFADAFAPGIADDGDGAPGGIPLPGWHIAASACGSCSTPSSAERHRSGRPASTR